MKQPTFHGRVLLPPSVFDDARAGDPLAMERILRCYDGYMNKLCTRTLYDLDGTPHVRVDEYMKHRLQNKLIRAILKDSLWENAGRRASRPLRPALSHGFSYAFRSQFQRGLDNLSRLPADHAGKALPRLGFYRPKCVGGRQFCRCHSASFFLLMDASGCDLYLHSIIHISRLVFFELMKYNDRCCRRCRYGLHDTQRGKREMGRFVPSSQLLLCRGAYPRRCENGWCLASS